MGCEMIIKNRSPNKNVMTIFGWIFLIASVIGVLVFTHKEAYNKKCFNRNLMGWNGDSCTIMQY